MVGARKCVYHTNKAFPLWLKEKMIWVAFIEYQASP